MTVTLLGEVFLMREIAHRFEGTVDKLNLSSLTTVPRPPLPLLRTGREAPIHDFIGWMAVKAGFHPEEGELILSPIELHGMSEFYGTPLHTLQKIFRKVVREVEREPWEDRRQWPLLTRERINPILGEMGVEFSLQEP